MSQDDREWFHEDRARREKLVWNEKSGEMEFDKPKRKRRLPEWAVDWLVFGGIIGGAWLLLELWQRYGKGLLP